MAHRYYIIHKPFGMLSQFTREVAEHKTLADLADFPSSVYPVGRLDRDSEGLLILTDDTSLNHRLLHPSHAHPRTYHVQVEGAPAAEDFARLAAGPAFRVKKQLIQPRPLEVKPLAPALAAGIPARNPPVRERKSVPDTWLELTLTEGKNRQVRRMCAAVGFPVLRLIRYAIAGVTLDDLSGEAVREVGRKWLGERLELRR